MWVQKVCSQMFLIHFLLGIMVCHINSLPYLTFMSSLVERLILQCFSRWLHIEEFGYFVSQNRMLPQKYKQQSQGPCLLKKKSSCLLVDWSKLNTVIVFDLRTNPVGPGIDWILFFIYPRRSSVAPLQWICPEYCKWKNCLGALMTRIIWLCEHDLQKHCSCVIWCPQGAGSPSDFWSVLHPPHC